MLNALAAVPATQASAFRPSIVPRQSDADILAHTGNRAVSAIIAAQPGTALSESGELFANFLLAKQREEEAVTARKEIQAQIALRVGTKEEGGTLHLEADGFKATTVQGIENSVTDRGADALRAILPEPLFNRLIRFKPAVDAKELNYIRSNEPDIYKVIADHVTVKRSSVSVKVEAVAK